MTESTNKSKDDDFGKGMTKPPEKDHYDVVKGLPVEDPKQVGPHIFPNKLSSTKKSGSGK